MSVMTENALAEIYCNIIKLKKSALERFSKRDFTSPTENNIYLPCPGCPKPAT